jgi:hypothetical protein
VTNTTVPTDNAYFDAVKRDVREMCEANDPLSMLAAYVHGFVRGGDERTTADASAALVDALCEYRKALIAKLSAEQKWLDCCGHFGGTCVVEGRCCCGDPVSPQVEEAETGVGLPDGEEGSGPCGDVWPGPGSFATCNRAAGHEGDHSDGQGNWFDLTVYDDEAGL